MIVQKPWFGFCDNSTEARLFNNFRKNWDIRNIFDELLIELLFNQNFSKNIVVVFSGKLSNYSANPIWYTHRSCSEFSYRKTTILSRCGLMWLCEKITNDDRPLLKTVIELMTDTSKHTSLSVTIYRLVIDGCFFRNKSKHLIAETWRYHLVNSCKDPIGFSRLKNKTYIFSTLTFDIFP